MADVSSLQQHIAESEPPKTHILDHIRRTQAQFATPESTAVTYASNNDPYNPILGYYGSHVSNRYNLPLFSEAASLMTRHVLPEFRRFCGDAENLLSQPGSQLSFQQYHQLSALHSLAEAFLPIFTARPGCPTAGITAMNDGLQWTSAAQKSAAETAETTLQSQVPLMAARLSGMVNSRVQAELAAVNNYQPDETSVNASTVA